MATAGTKQKQIEKNSELDKFKLFFEYVDPIKPSAVSRVPSAVSRVNIRSKKS